MKHMKIRKFLSTLGSLAMCLAILCAMMLPVLADDGIPVEDEKPNTDITVIPSDANALVLMDVGAESPKGVPGDVVTVVIPVAVNKEYLPSERQKKRLRRKLSPRKRVFGRTVIKQPERSCQIPLCLLRLQFFLRAVEIEKPLSGDIRSAQIIRRLLGELFEVDAQQKPRKLLVRLHFCL